jgi:hypothetical protein
MQKYNTKRKEYLISTKDVDLMIRNVGNLAVDEA